MSPALWIGVAGSAVLAAWSIRSGRATPGDVIVGLALCAIAFVIGLVAVFAAVVVYWTVLWLVSVAGGPKPTWPRPPRRSDGDHSR